MRGKQTSPVICGVMDADWCYYLLIAPHCGSSTFEDQSSCVRLIVPTQINPRWTSINLTVLSVHLPLLRAAWLAGMQQNQQSYYVSFAQRLEVRGRVCSCYSGTASFIVKVSFFKRVSFLFVPQHIVECWRVALESMLLFRFLSGGDYRQPGHGRKGAAKSEFLICLLLLSSV